MCNVNINPEVEVCNSKTAPLGDVTDTYTQNMPTNFESEMFLIFEKIKESKGAVFYKLRI